MGSKILYMLPALVLALLALILAVVGLSRDPEPVTITPSDAASQTDQEEAAPSYEYWVLRQPLNAGDTLGEDSLAVVTSPTQISDALGADEAVIGRELRRYARPGELLSNHHLESGGSLPANLPEGQRAIAISVDDVVSAGGLLQPGDRVDVVTAFRRSDKDAPVALVMLRDVPVLAVYGALSAGADDADETARRRNNTAVLSVPEERVSALMLASSEGKVRLAVVAGERGDTPAGDTDEPAGDGDQALAAAEEAEQKPFYFDDFFPEREKAAPAAAPKPSPGRRVQVFEGAESRSTYVQ
ncbi:MAG TPA: Flp pilus assembly protein CpaB [Alcanivorax sp.]|nr:Flp pilus assembly protein CpaB [Alcanivorax sp.]HAD64082.1 Flp pilus assembly protein CpaB [Alcanivorax sp.]HBY49623.1 Flp pilus assembly protein CpaB [Alcanivorax sp.]HCI10253.1 Flp pilus assembly protein CpaB [Alcanivorax sp.]|tara:strand:+ start:6566 stop:7465 length:900 start_codon:yes stop_codon:yes gene_type:complete